METVLEKLEADQTELKSLEPLYTASFPDYEAKPFEMILDGVRSHRMEAYVLKTQQNESAALAFVILGRKAVLLDYLAVDPAFQSHGFGSRILDQLSELYDAPLIVEIESTYENVDDEEKNLRIRRKNFYLRNGFYDDEEKIRLFGVDMELMSTRSKLSFEDYFEILDEYLNAYHISGRRHVLSLNEDRN